MFALQEGAIDPAPGAIFLRERWQDRNLMIHINTAALQITSLFLFFCLVSALQEGSIDPAPGAVFLRERWQDCSSNELMPHQPNTTA
jgi:hypothetical protein